jgi:hypothetical protein
MDPRVARNGYHQWSAQVTSKSGGDGIFDMIGANAARMAMLSSATEFSWSAYIYAALFKLYKLYENSYGTAYQVYFFSICALILWYISRNYKSWSNSASAASRLASSDHPADKSTLDDSPIEAIQESIGTYSILRVYLTHKFWLGVSLFGLNAYYWYMVNFVWSHDYKLSLQANYWSSIIFMFWTTFKILPDLLDCIVNQVAISKSLIVRRLAELLIVIHASKVPLPVLLSQWQNMSIYSTAFDALYHLIGRNTSSSDGSGKQTFTYNQGIYPLVPYLGTIAFLLDMFGAWFNIGRCEYLSLISGWASIWPIALYAAAVLLVCFGVDGWNWAKRVVWNACGAKLSAQFATFFRKNVMVPAGSVDNGGRESIFLPLTPLDELVIPKPEPPSLFECALASAGIGATDRSATTLDSAPASEATTLPAVTLNQNDLIVLGKLYTMFSKNTSDIGTALRMSLDCVKDIGTPALWSGIATRYEYLRRQFVTNNVLDQRYPAGGRAVRKYLTWIYQKLTSRDLDNPGNFILIQPPNFVADDASEAVPSSSKVVRSIAVEPLREISIPAVPALSVSRADQLTLERFVGQNPELSNEWASLLQLIFRDSNSVPIDADELAKQRATAYNALISHIGTAFERYESQNPAEAAQVSRILLDIYKKLTASASV